MNYKEVLKIACDHLLGLRGQVMDVVDIDKPPNIEYAQHLAKILSKLSPRETRKSLGKQNFMLHLGVKKVSFMTQILNIRIKSKNSLANIAID